MKETILRVARGKTIELYRVRLLDEGGSALERFENGGFGPPRIFRDRSEPTATLGPADPAARMKRAVDHITGFLNGAVSVGERELLSPTSAMVRNARWFPGDIQMLRTAFFYARELFPSAQFHVSQLFRRVFGDITFLALVVVSCGLWLGTDAPVGGRRVALGLQIISTVAIFGFDRYWEPMRLRLRRLRAASWTGPRWHLLFRVPVAVIGQIGLGTASLMASTLLGLANLIIHPSQLWRSWRQLGGGRALEWKASSVSAGQDARGWPLDEFREAYRPAVKVGWLASLFGLWLVALGAPIGIFGLNGAGLFLASFLTVVLYAWCVGLPEVEGAPQYRPTRRELARLCAAGLLGCGATVALIRVGIYPLPAFEGSSGVVVAFLSLSALVAVAFPVHHCIKYFAHRRPRARLASRTPRPWQVAIVALVGASCLVTCHARTGDGGWPSRPAGWPAFLRVDERQWRMPEAERRLYEEIERTRRRHAQVDPEPLLRAQAAAPTLVPPATVPTPELADLRGIPAPRLPVLKTPPVLSLPELLPLPARERTFLFKPRRRFTSTAAEPTREAAPAVESGHHATEVAQRRAAAVTPRRLTAEERRAQEELIAGSRYPWITREELERLGRADARGESIPLVEMARSFRWDVVDRLWDAVPAARADGASDRVRFQRLRDGVEGVIALGHQPTAFEVERYLGEELALVDQWSRLYPRIPLGALLESPLSTPSRFSQITRLLIEKGRKRDELADAWRLDYVNSYWDAPSATDGAAIQRVFRDRPPTRSWERFALDWGPSPALGQRWEALQTEQALASKVWEAAAPGGARPTAQQLRIIVELLNKVLGALLADAPAGPYARLAHLFALDGVDSQALAAGDPVAALWAARVWTEAMAGRVAKTVYRASAGISLPGTAVEQDLVRQVARARYPDDAGDPTLRRILDWLVLVDHAETTAELADGYDQFARELAERGVLLQGLSAAPHLSEDQITADLLWLWQELPGRFPAIPARDDMVAELLCHLAHFSSRDGRSPRTAAELVEDFSAQLRQVNDAMGTALPPAVQALADHLVQSTMGRKSGSVSGRRFFGWWLVATEGRALQNDLDHHGLARPEASRPAALAASWAEILEAGARRWPHLPWSKRGFAEFYLHIQALEGWSLDELWRHFGDQLAAADGLAARHVIPARAFESLVERRIQRKTGAPTFDPTLRRANAIMALARLLEVARLNGVEGFQGNPALLADRLSRLHERLARDYPHLDWDSEGMLEWYLLIGLRQHWEIDETVARFAPEWALANTLAASGWLARLTVAALQEERPRNDEERVLRQFVDVQARRLEERTGLLPESASARAMNALAALAALVLAAGEEGQIPEQRGTAWSQARVRTWASGLVPGKLGPATLAWTRSLIGTWSELLNAMRAEGPRFPWQRGAIVETNLLAMAGTAATVPAQRAGHRAAWRLASDLFASGFELPPAFENLVRDTFQSELRRKLAAARGLPEAEVPAADLLPEDPSLFRLDALLALAEMLSAVRAAYVDAPDPAALARRVVEVREVGRRRFPFVPWDASGFTSAFVVATYRQDFRDDPWKYAALTEMPAVDQLLGELSRRASGLPPEVTADVRAMMRAQSGHAPSSDQVVAYQALHDGLFLLREFLPEVPRSLDNVIAVVRLRGAVRALDAAYPELHIVRGEDQSLRVGFADRLGVMAMKLALASGDDPGQRDFTRAALDRVKARFLDGMSRIYGPLRASLTAEEAELEEITIREQARQDNPSRAARFGLSPEALVLPEVKADDLVADAALYETLYASEIGQDQTYLGDLFAIFGAVRRRPESVRLYRQGLDDIDQRFAPELKRPGQAGYEVWRASDGYRAWWAARAAFLQANRGQAIAVARTLALVKRGAFSERGDPTARASFARFGTFDEYLGAFLDAFEAVPRVPELGAALEDLRGDDPFLADGMRFALALFKCHVVNRLYPDPRSAEEVLRGIAAELPGVMADHRRILGFSPRFESGIPLYDARMSFLRRRAIGGGAGSEVYRRLNLVQRSVQRWSQAYIVKQAYKVLFFRDLDANDPTPVAPRAGSMADRLLLRTRGDETTRFLEERLPEALLAATGSGDFSVWIGWLMEHGELGLDGKPTGHNPYADELAGYEARLARYRERIASGNVAGANVRAEQQRVRDIERERGSFQRQVAWLMESARGAAPLTALARRDYREAIWLHAVLPLAVILLLGMAVRSVRRRPVRLLAVWLPLVLVVGVPVAVSIRAGDAARIAPRFLQRARLVEREGEGFRPRGAAAQLAKVWRARGGA